MFLATVIAYWKTERNIQTSLKPVFVASDRFIHSKTEMPFSSTSDKGEIPHFFHVY
jgi:hypothetical protein